MTPAKAVTKPSISVSVEPDDKAWQAEADMRTLIEHHRITKDPKRHAAAKAMAKKKADEMNAVQKQ